MFVRDLWVLWLELQSKHELCTAGAEIHWQHQHQHQHQQRRHTQHLRKKNISLLQARNGIGSGLVFFKFMKMPLFLRTTKEGKYLEQKMASSGFGRTLNSS